MPAWLARLVHQNAPPTTASRAWLTSVVESTGDAIVGTRLDGTIESWNPAAERLYGYPAAEALGQHDEILTPRARRTEGEELRARVIAGEIVSQLETEALRKDASTVPVALTASPIRDAREKVIGMAQIVRDVTDRTRFEHELRFFADHDPLTGLFNRRRFAKELARHVAFSERYPQIGGALLMADLDNLKSVNDSFGHKAGDEMIKAVARQLRARLRDTDVLGRLGGDEFAVLLPRADLELAAGVAGSLGEAVRNLEMIVEGRRLRPTVSIGVAPLNGDLASEDSLAAADVAMYEAKRRGRDGFATAAAEGSEAGDESALGWAERLRAALAEDRFELYSQPIFEIAGGEVARFEVLLRLREMDKLVPPSAFIHMAERFGLIDDIDRHVISRVVRLLAADRGGEAKYHVNLSGVSIAKPALLDFLSDELGANGVDPSRLIFEVSETAAMIDMDATQHFARSVHDIGCAFALDDFGSGFGSFSYLKYIPVQFVKIDGSFVAGLAENNHDRLLVKAITEVAHGMQMQAIAEHITSERTRKLLEGYGTDYGQGYHLGEPQLLHAAR